MKRVLVAIIAIFIFLDVSPSEANESVPLYGVFELSVTNVNTYNNPFDYSEIEPQGAFTAPSGKVVYFFGFHDGDGNGNQSGNVWKMRFMPDELGTWTYTYSWAGTGAKPAGGSGSFDVIDTELPGPLKIASDSTWFFEDSRGNLLDARPYGTMDIDNYWDDWYGVYWGALFPYFKNLIDTELIPKRWNMMYMFLGRAVEASWPENYWNNDQIDYFNIKVWNDIDAIFRYASGKEIYIFFQAALMHHSYQNYYTNNLKKYWIARFSPYYNVFGYSPTWEFGLVWSESRVNAEMESLQSMSPFNNLLSIHDSSRSAFTTWLDFSMRQQQVGEDCSGNNVINRGQELFNGNCPRTAGEKGGVQPPFDQYPIFGAEDIWENPSGGYGQPRNPTEVRRGAWGEMMASVIPVYSEWLGKMNLGGNLDGDIEVIRMFDFFYSKTKYRQYVKLNDLVSSEARQICSGISGEEYLIYDDDGGSIQIDLTLASGIFNVLWYDPKSGAEQAGSNVVAGNTVTLSSPFSGDSVVLISRTALDTIAPSAPTNLMVLE